MNRQQRRERKAWILVLALVAFAASRRQVQAQAEGEPMIAVSADIVEISGSISRDTGFTWGPLTTGIIFNEKTPIPGIIKINDFERATALQTTLRLLETEGKAQILSNPKVITKSGTQANFVVGGDQPYPVTTNQGVG